MLNRLSVRSSILPAGALVVGLLLGMTAIVFAQANGRLVLGQSGATPGALTLMPPDGTGWYHIDNPGKQMMRISGGGQPGQYLYVTVSHPGRVTIYGDLEVKGNLVGRATQTGRPTGGDSGGKSDSARPEDVQYLQNQVDQLKTQVNGLVAKVNALSR
jgi:hypothetical protein